MSGYRDYVRTNFNGGADVQYADRTVALADVIAGRALKRVDLLKIDTDGADFEVLRSLGASIDTVRPLWIQIEVSISPSGQQPDGSFSEVDGYLRTQGYTLVDLESWRYARAALPAPFAYDLPAQTRTGPIAWGDATYVDDPLATSGELTRWLESDDGLARAVRLAALYDGYGLADCAAELLAELRRHPLSAERADWTAMLDLLVPENPYEAQTYDAYIAAFQTDPAALYPSRLEPAADLASQNARLQRELGIAQRMVERRKRRMLLLSTRTVAAQAETERLRAKLAATEGERRSLNAELGDATAEARRLQSELDQARIERTEAEAAWAATLDRARIERAEAEAAWAATLDRARIERSEAEADWAATLDRVRIERSEAEADWAATLDRVRIEAAEALETARNTWQEAADRREHILVEQHAAREAALAVELKGQLAEADERARRESLVMAGRHAGQIAALRSEHARATDALAGAMNAAATREAETRHQEAEMRRQAEAETRQQEAETRRQGEAQLRSVQERLLDQTRKSAEREAAILTRVREAWSLDARDRGDVFDVLASARKHTQELERERQALKDEVARLDEARASLHGLLARSGRFTLRRWLAGPGSKDPLKALP